MLDLLEDIAADEPKRSETPYPQEAPAAGGRRALQVGLCPGHQPGAEGRVPRGTSAPHPSSRGWGPLSICFFPWLPFPARHSPTVPGAAAAGAVLHLSPSRS